MRLRNTNRSAFTLIEVAISIGILSFGLTAILVVYLTSLRWAEEIRIDMTSLHMARAAVYDAGVLTDKDDVGKGYDNSDTPAEGYVNDYYVVRTFVEDPLPGMVSSIGRYVTVNVEVFYGGDKDTGRPVQNIECDQFLLSGYKP